MSATGKNVSKYSRMVGWVLLFLLIAAMVLLLIPANGFFFLMRWFAEYKSKSDLIGLGIVLIISGFESYRFIKRTQNPWRSIAVIVVFIIPANVLLWVAWFIAKNIDRLNVDVIALGIFLIYLAIKTYGFLKRNENPWQTFRDNLTKNLTILFTISFIIYACMVLYSIKFPNEYDRCDFYNKELGGRVKEYQGRKFKVHLCGTGDYDGRFEYKPDEIRLQVFNEKGDLVALRHFKIDWQSSFDREIEYHSNHIAYIDESSSTNTISLSTKTISMPPTALDWIRARIPLLD